MSAPEETASASSVDGEGVPSATPVKGESLPEKELVHESDVPENSEAVKTSALKPHDEQKGGSPIEEKETEYVPTPADQVTTPVDAEGSEGLLPPRESQASASEEVLDYPAASSSSSDAPARAANSAACRA